jgi:hypothetical protein
LAAFAFLQHGMVVITAELGLKIDPASMQCPCNRPALVWIATQVSNENRKFARTFGAAVRHARKERLELC